MWDAAGSVRWWVRGGWALLRSPENRRGAHLLQDYGTLMKLDIASFGRLSATMGRGIS